MKCKNCGCSCTSNFCPECGQSVQVERLENRSFFIGVISGLSRINKGFLFTAWNLLIHPWVVIRDYIYCRRIRYVAPISMLIIVCFISAVIGDFFHTGTQSSVSDMSGNDIPLLYKIILYIGNYLMSNVLAQNLTIYAPALLAIPLVYGKVGAKKFNMAEYFTAMVYMASAFLIFGVIAYPLIMISESIYSAAEYIYSVIICSLGMYKAFSVSPVKKRIIYLVRYIFVVCLIYLSFMILIGIMIGIGLKSV